MTADQQAYIAAFQANLQRAQAALAAYDRSPGLTRTPRATLEAALLMAQQQLSTAQNVVSQGLV